MGKYLWRKLVKELDLDYGVEFVFANDESNKIYKFCQNGLVYRYADTTNFEHDKEAAYKLLNGDLDIVILPYVPTEGKSYYTYIYDINKHTWCVRRKDWRGTPQDYFALKCGCVFKTDIMALINFKDKYKELTGREWNPPYGITEPYITY